MVAERANPNVFILGAGSADHYVLSDEKGDPYLAPGHEPGAKTSISPEAQAYYDSLPDTAFDIKIGGNGANMGRRAAIQGYDVHFLSVRGEDESSRAIEQDLAGYSQITDRSIASPDHISSRAYVERRPNEDRHIRNAGRTSLGLTIAGPHISELMDGANIAIATSVKSPSLHETFFKEALRSDMARCDKRGQRDTRTSVDQLFVAALPGSTDFEKNQASLLHSFAERRPNVLFGNKEELHSLAVAGNPENKDTSADAEYILQQVRHLGEFVVLTDGPNGILMSIPSYHARSQDSKQTLHVPALEVPRITDTTGAGDSVAWTLTHELYAAKSEKVRPYSVKPHYEGMMRRAARVGASAIQHLGAVGDVEHLKA